MVKTALKGIEQAIGAKGATKAESENPFLEGGKLLVNQKNVIIESFSAGIMVVKPFRGHPFVILVGGGQCVIEEERRHG